MNTINFKIESIVVPTGTRTFRTSWIKESEKILTVKEWIKRKKMETIIKDQFAHSMSVTKEIQRSMKEELDAFIKKEYGYDRKP